MIVSFWVPGLPISQGSKRLIGKQMVESSKKLKPWRERVASRAEDQMIHMPPFDEPLWLTARFQFLRPRAHFRTGRFSGVLKESAPTFVPTYPDLSKLQRAIEDALEGIVFRNDSLIVQAFTEKLYDEYHGVWITLGPVSEGIPSRLIAASGGDIHHATAVQRMVEART